MKGNNCRKVSNSDHRVTIPEAHDGFASLMHEASHGKLHPAGKYYPFQKAPRGDARRGRTRRHRETARGGRGERRASPAQAMNRRGIEFSLVQLEPDLWRWQFQIGEVVMTGKTKTSLKGMAARRAQERIDRALRLPRDLRRSDAR